MNTLALHQMSEKDHKGNEANEPIGTYRHESGRSLRFFHSFEEMNEADAEDAAATSPLDRLSNVTRLIMNQYAQELSQKPELRIYFKK